MELSHDHPNPDEAAVDYSLLGGDHARRGERLFRTGLVLLLAAAAYFGSAAQPVDPWHVFQGLAVLVLAVAPLLIWARSGGSRFPVFEPMMLLCASSYAFPLLNGREQLAGYSADVITHAGWTVILYQVTALVIYLSVRGTPGQTPFWRESILTPSVEKRALYGVPVFTVYIAVSTLTEWIPPDYDSILHAVCYGIGILSTFVTAQRWGRGEMNPTEKTIFLAAFIPQLLLLAVSLVLINAIWMIGVALLGYLSGGKRVPWIPIVSVFAILAVLHAGKARMREKYWEGGAPAPTLTRLPGFFSEWVADGLEHREDTTKSVSRQLLERTSLMHILCLVIEATPDRQDYLYGKTYGYVLPQLVPRLLWPGKPRSHIGTYELSVYYGLQSEDATENTTIAFGLLPEAYANFGLVGGLLLGAFWGLFLKKLQIWSAHSPMFSFAGLLMILLTAWSFSAELTMAAWVSSLEQAVVVVLGVPLVLHRFFRA